MYSAAHVAHAELRGAPRDPVAAAIDRLCKTAGCSQVAVSKGLCVLHGGGKQQCSSAGCTSKAQSGSQYCRRHGGSKRCTVDGCDRVDVGGGLCRAHGGGKRCAVCGKAAVSAGKCVAHGGGKRCKHLGCEKGAQGQSDYCKAHGGGRRCKVDNCNKGAQGSSEYCIAHGGGTRCKMDGCTKLARRKGLCQTHLRSLMEEQSSTSSAQLEASLPPALQSAVSRQQFVDPSSFERKSSVTTSPSPMFTLADAASKMASTSEPRSSMVSEDSKYSSDAHSHISPHSDAARSSVANLEGLEVELLLHVPGMSCMSSCGAQVEHVLHTLPFVKQTAVDIEKKVVRVVCTTEPAFDGDLAANGLLEPGLHESLVQERFVRFSKSRFAIISTNLDTIGFQCRLVQVYKVVRTQAFDVSAATTSDFEQPVVGVKRRRTDESISGSGQASQHEQNLQSPAWLISTALGLLQTGCMMRFGRDCTCGDDCQCERCPKHPKETHRTSSEISPADSEHVSDPTSFGTHREDDYLDLYENCSDFGDLFDGLLP